jgi:hypothetical protein
MNERELFIAALRIANEGERSAYLDQSCADDPALKKGGRGVTSRSFRKR